jgi:hypothetical protein
MLYHLRPGARIDPVCDDREAITVDLFVDASTVRETYRELCAGNVGALIELETWHRSTVVPARRSQGYARTTACWPR